MIRNKLLLIIATDNFSGPAKGIFQLMRNIDNSKYELHLFNFSASGVLPDLFVAEAEKNNIRVNLFYQKGHNYFGVIRQAFQVVDKIGINLVQTHGFKPSFVGFFLKIFKGIRWICFMHGTTSENLKVRLYNLVDNILQLAAHRTMLVSEAQRRKAYGGSNVKRVHVLHNAVDMECPMPMSIGARPLRKLFDLQAESRIVVAVGRFSPEKGTDVLLDAFALLVRQVNDTYLVLVGDGQERLALEAQVQRLGLAGVVHFAGYTKTPGDYVAEADLFVLPSRSEGIPNAVLEAMAMGKPVVATAVGGVPEIIENSISGLLVPSDEPLLLAQAMANVLTNPHLSQRLAVEGKQRVGESFSIKARVTKLQNLYQEVFTGA